MIASVLKRPPLTCRLHCHRPACAALAGVALALASPSHASILTTPASRVAQASPTTLAGLQFAPVASGPALSTNLIYAWAGLPGALRTSSPSSPSAVLDPFYRDLAPDAWPLTGVLPLPKPAGWDTRAIALEGGRLLVVAAHSIPSDQGRFSLYFTSGGATNLPSHVDPDTAPLVATTFSDAVPVGPGAVAIVWLRHEVPATLVARVFSTEGAALGEAVAVRDLALDAVREVMPLAPRGLVKSGRPGEFVVAWPETRSGVRAGSPRDDDDDHGDEDDRPPHRPDSEQTRGFYIRSFGFDGSARGSVSIGVLEEIPVIERVAVLDDGRIVAVGSGGCWRDFLTGQLLGPGGEPLRDIPAFPVHYPGLPDSLGHVRGVLNQTAQTVVAMGSGRFAVLWTEKGFLAPPQPICPPREDDEDGDDDDDGDDDGDDDDDDRNRAARGGRDDEDDDDDDDFAHRPHTRFHAPVFRVFNEAAKPLSPAMVIQGTAPNGVSPFWANLCVLGTDRLATTSVFFERPDLIIADAQVYQVDGTVELDFRLATVKARKRGKTVRILGHLDVGEQRQRFGRGAFALRHGLVQNFDDCVVEQDEIAWSDERVRCAKRSDRKGRIRFRARHRINGAHNGVATLMFSEFNGPSEVSSDTVFVQVSGKKRRR